MDDLIKGFFEGLRPIRRLSVSEWADANRYLSSESSAEPGKWRTDRTPYLRQIMDDLSATSPVQEVIVMKGAQLGFTESGLNLVGYTIDVHPGPIMYILPTVDMIKTNSKSRIDPMINSSPSLRDKVKPAKSRESGNTILNKQFPGGMLVLGGANSSATLSSVPMRTIILDEVDRFPLDVDGEGSPVALAEARTQTFSNKKIFKLSTPTVNGVSVIEKEFERTQQFKYFVPCPHCGSFQLLVFDQLRKLDNGSVVYECSHCGEHIDERFKTQMLANGRWEMTVPENDNRFVRGYWINSLYSPYGWLYWHQIIEKHEKSKEDVTLLKTFVNTVLAETYDDPGDAPEWEHLYNRREPYGPNSVPAEVSFITAGVDVQRDRLEVEVVGWAKGKISYSIEYRVLVGDTAAQSVWDQLAAMLNETWRRADGAALPIRLMAVDSGYNTSQVYKFCEAHDASRVIPTKGSSTLQTIVAQPRPVQVSRAGKKIGKVKVWLIGVNIVKSELYGWLRLVKDEEGGDPPGYCHFPEYDQRYFQMITSEKLTITKDRRGFTKTEWILPSGARNEALDCRVYARAAASVVGMDRFMDEHWQEMHRSYGLQQQSQPAVRKKKSSFWDR